MKIPHWLRHPWDWFEYKHLPLYCGVKQDPNYRENFYEWRRRKYSQCRWCPHTEIYHGRVVTGTNNYNQPVYLHVCAHWEYSPRHGTRCDCPGFEPIPHPLKYRIPK